jgi:hypothetical protein
MLDSNFASKPHSCGPELTISEDLKQCHTKASLGTAAKMSIGLEWRDPNVSEYKKLWIFGSHSPGCDSMLPLSAGCLSWQLIV